MELEFNGVWDSLAMSTWPIITIAYNYVFKPGNLKIEDDHAVFPDFVSYKGPPEHCIKQPMQLVQN